MNLSKKILKIKMDEIHQRIKDFAAKQETNMTILQSSFLQKFYEIVMMKEPQDEDKVSSEAQQNKLKD